jgi:hypothetical protein
MINVPTIFDFDQGNSKARCRIEAVPGVHPALGATGAAAPGFPTFSTPLSAAHNIIL